MLTVGVVVNPVAGIGGPAALKGSDGVAIQAAALAAGAVALALARMRITIEALRPYLDEVRFKTWGGAMGADAFDTDFDVSILGEPANPSSSADTRAAVAALAASGIDVLLFAGGDGTARDIMDVLGSRVPVLGVPAGVKMQSGVFAITPADAAEVLIRLARGQMVALVDAEVRDIDEAALRRGRVDGRHYGYLRVPQAGGFVQHMKSSGREDEALVHLDIARYVADQIRALPGTVVLGPGSTVAAIKSELGIEPTLLGFDVVKGASLIASDADARTLEQLVDESTIVVLSFTGGQGFLIGRGNQQLSPAVLQRLPRDNLWIVATRTKLDALGGEPLRVDTSDAGLDTRFFGVYPIIVGDDDVLLHRVGRGL